MDRINELLKLHDPEDRNTYVGIIKALAPAVTNDLWNQEHWSGHSFEVACYTSFTAHAMGRPFEDAVVYGRAAYLHDDGKLDKKLKPLFAADKPKYTPEEKSEAERHAYVGALRSQEKLRDCGDLSVLWQAIACNITHHLPFSGGTLDEASHTFLFPSGERRWIAGKEIPLIGRLASPVDVYSALTDADRQYKRTWSETDAMKYLWLNAGKLFDPEVVNAFTTKVLKRKRPAKRAMAAFPLKMAYEEFRYAAVGQKIKKRQPQNDVS